MKEDNIEHRADQEHISKGQKKPPQLYYAVKRKFPKIE